MEQFGFALFGHFCFGVFTQKSGSFRVFHEIFGQKPHLKAFKVGKKVAHFRRYLLFYHFIKNILLLIYQYKYRYHNVWKKVAHS
jgi:hypothetical protein